MADSSLDWKKLVGTVAPTLGTMLLGPLAGTAIEAISSVFLGKSDGTKEEIKTSLTSTGMSHTQIIELQRLNNEHLEKITQSGIDLDKLNASVQIELIKDVQDARKLFNDKIFWLGVVILSIFAVTMTLCLYGAYMLLVGGITLKDVSVVAGVSGFIGTIVGYIAANAQQVVGYFFGSSAGSDKKSDAIAHSISNLPATVQK